MQGGEDARDAPIHQQGAETVCELVCELVFGMSWPIMPWMMDKDLDAAWGQCWERS